MPSVIAALMLGVFALFAPEVPEQVAVVLQPPPPPEARILFGGDMMFDRFVRTKIEAHGGNYVLECVASTLQSVDLVVANLEGPITATSSMSVGSEIGSPENFTFTFPTSTAPLLSRHNIKMVNLGNNHIMNFGEDGLRQTMVYLADNDVGFFGSPLISSLTRREVAGVAFEFISYNEFLGGGNGSLVKHQVNSSRKEGFVPVVYAHWGDEYATTSQERIKKLAHEFVDAGAEIVIGSHPHVVQDHEIYRGKHIYYSLGNFVFDQYWNADVRTGLLLGIVFSANGVEEIEEIPIALLRDGRTCLIE